MRFLGFFLLPFVCALSVQGATINEILVEGNRHVLTQEILDVIETKVGDDLDAPVTRWKFQNDLKAIYALGFFKNVNVVSESSGLGVNLIYLVEEKPRIVELRYEGNEEYKAKRLNKEIGFTGKERIFFDEDNANHLKQQILDFYISKSFPNTTMTWRTEENSDGDIILIFTIKEGKKLPIREILFHGNTVLIDKVFRKRMETKESWWFIIKHNFDHDEAELDMQRIQHIYWEIGYLDAKATLGEIEETDDGLRININIEEGQPYTVGEITIDGNSIFSSEELLTHITLQPGDRFSYTQLYDDEKEMLDMYLAQGYLDARLPDITQQWKKDGTNKVVDIHMRVTEANTSPPERTYLGKVEIQGVVTIDQNTIIPTQGDEFKTKPNVIRRELEIKEGEPLDWTKVVESDRNLVNTQLFRSRGFGRRDTTNLIPGFQRQKTSDPNVENLLLQLEEQDSGQISFGGGLSTTFGPSVFATYTERNILGYGIRGSVTGELGQFRNQLRLSIFDPHVLDSDFSLDWEIYYMDIEGIGGRRFDEQRIGTQMTIGQELTDEFQLLYGFKIEQADISPDERRGALDPTTIPREFNLGQTTTTSLLFGLVHDTRDFKQDPTSGFYNRATIEFAGLTDNEFIKLRSENNYYRTIFEKIVLALSSDLQLGYAYGDPGYLPIQERFFVGGARSIRGFDEGSIGRSAVILFQNPTQGGFRTFLGGEAAYVGSAELRYPFTDIFQGVVFLDMGTVWDEIGDIDPSEFRFSTGAGIRVRIPGFNNALLRLDFGFPLRDFPGDDTQFFHFGFSQAF